MGDGIYYYLESLRVERVEGAECVAERAVAHARRAERHEAHLVMNSKDVLAAQHIGSTACAQLDDTLGRGLPPPHWRAARAEYDHWPCSADGLARLLQPVCSRSADRAHVQYWS